MDTLAIPQTLHLRPIQLTAVPVKVSVAVAPVTLELPACPPLKAAISERRITHAPAGPALIAGLVSSKRVVPPGGVVSLATVTVTGADVVRLPAASRATAVMVCEPLVVAVVFQGTEYGAVVTSGPGLPSRMDCSQVTAVSSAALAVTVIVPETVSPETGELMVTVGAVRSFATVTVTGAEVVRWPAASRATAVSVCDPLVAVFVFHGAANGALVTSVPGLPSRKNCTPVTAVSSSALAVKVIVPDTVSPEAGELMLTVGGVLSLATVTVTGADVVRLPAASRATAVMVCEPLVALFVFQVTEYGAVVTSVPALPSR